MIQSKSIHRKSASTSTLPTIFQPSASLPTSPSNLSSMKKRSALSIASFKNTRPIPVYGTPASKIGPGHYILNQGSVGPSFEFSLNPRFESTYHDRINSDLHTVFMSRQRMHLSESSFSTSFIQENKKVGHINLNYNLQVVRERALANEQRSKRAKTLKLSRMAQRSNDLTAKLQSKFLRYELRMHKDEIQINLASWLTLACAIGSARILRNRYTNKIVMLK